MDHQRWVIEIKGTNLPPFTDLASSTPILFLHNTTMPASAGALFLSCVLLNPTVRPCQPHTLFIPISSTAAQHHGKVIQMQETLPVHDPNPQADNPVQLCKAEFFRNLEVSTTARQE